MTDAAKIGPYTVVRRLGMGGTSEVLLATSRGPFDFARYVVIKRLLPRYRKDPTMARMLAHEAMAYARLSHPAIVRLYEFLADQGELALVLEYVDGITLARLRSTLRARGHRLGDDAAYYVAKRVFAALAAAHAARDPATGVPAPVVHRDVSPGNVLVPRDGFVKLADFGIAKVSGTLSDTHDGLIKGTDGYMAPEQVRGGIITPATDVYAACLVLRELLTGRPAFTRGAATELEFLRMMAEPEIPPIELLRAGLPAPVVDALRRGLAANPAARTLDAAEMVALMSRVVDGERGRAALVRILETMTPAEPSAAVEMEAPHARAPSEGSVRAQVLGTPYAYVPSPPSVAPTTNFVSFAPPRLAPVWGLLIGAVAGVVLVACSVAAWSFSKPPSTAATASAPSATPTTTAGAGAPSAARSRAAAPRKTRAR